MKKIFILISSLLLCMASSVCLANEETNIKILCLGNYLEPDVAPFYADSRIMAPVRAVFESVGATVSWDDASKKATGKKGGTEVTLTLGSNVITVNGEQILMDTVLVEKESRVFAPIRFVAESFGYEVCFHDESETAVISDSSEYEFYSSISAALPRFDSVTDAQLISQQKDPDGYDTYSYVYSEDYATEYFNALQADFGYSLYNIYFEAGAHIYEYLSPNGHIVKVADYHNSNGTICITVTPNTQQEFAPGYSAQEQAGLPQQPPAQPKPDNPSSPEQAPPDSSLDYAAVTGAGFIDSYEASDGAVIYRYVYNRFAHMQYESHIAALGWYFYDFDFNLDTFSNTTYYSNGNDILVTSVSHILGEVWVMYP